MIILATWYTLTTWLSSSTPHLSCHMPGQFQGDSYRTRSAGFVAKNKTAKSRCRHSTTSHRSRRKHSIDSECGVWTDGFVYLGTVFPSDSYCRRDINRRIGRASSVMSSLHHIWRNRRLSVTTRTRIYQTLVQSVLYAAESETWTLLSVDARRPEPLRLSI